MENLRDCVASRYFVLWFAEYNLWQENAIDFI